VVNNLIVSANLGIEAHCRVLLTTPIETFSSATHRDQPGVNRHPAG